MTAEEHLPFSRAVGYARLAIEFSDAAAREDVDQARPSMVLYFLVGHAVELALKAVLLVDGTSESRLRDLGHDLTACLSEARGHLPDGVAELTAEDSSRLELLAGFYRSKAFEYVEPGSRTLPEQSEILELTCRLVEQIQTWVEGSVRQALR